MGELERSEASSSEALSIARAARDLQGTRMALFAITVWLVFNRRRHPTRLWWIPPIVAVWANVHGSFFLAPVLLGLAWLEDSSAVPPSPARTSVKSERLRSTHVFCFIAPPPFLNWT